MRESFFLREIKMTNNGDVGEGEVVSVGVLFGGGSGEGEGHDIPERRGRG